MRSRPWRLSDTLQGAAWEIVGAPNPAQHLATKLRIFSPSSLLREASTHARQVRV